MPSHQERVRRNYEDELSAKAETLAVRSQFEMLEMVWPGPLSIANVRQFARYLRRQADMMERIDFRAQGMK